MTGWLQRSRVMRTFRSAEERQETKEQSMRAMRARGFNGYGINPIAKCAVFSQLAKHLIVLFSERDSLTQKGKQHGQHKHYHGYTLRTIDRCNRAGGFQADAGKSSEVTRLHPQSDGNLSDYPDSPGRVSRVGR